MESLGISLQSSGIRVGDDKCFLVNLNADPALNELLVYYLKVVGSPVLRTHGLEDRILYSLTNTTLYEELLADELESW